MAVRTLCFRLFSCFLYSKTNPKAEHFPAAFLRTVFRPCSNCLSVGCRAASPSSPAGCGNWGVFIGIPNAQPIVKYLLSVCRGRASLVAIRAHHPAVSGTGAGEVLPSPPILITAFVL